MTLNAILFVDARLSSPKLDWIAMQDASLSCGYGLTISHDGRVYSVVDIDAVPDDTGKLHHYEVGLK